MQLSCYLNFNGRCAAAFAVYAKALGGTITFTQSTASHP